MPESALIGTPCLEAFRRSAHGSLLFDRGNGRSNGDRYRFRYLILNRKDVHEIAVVALCPDVLAGLGLDELSSNANPIPSAAQAALEHPAHAELAADLSHVD